MARTKALKSVINAVNSGTVGDKYYATDTGESFTWDGSTVVNHGVIDDKQAADLASEITRANAKEGTFTKAPVAAPGSATATGVAGTWAYDATHIYVCISTNVWVRATLATW